MPKRAEVCASELLHISLINAYNRTTRSLDPPALHPNSQTVKNKNKKHYLFLIHTCM